MPYADPDKQREYFARYRATARGRASQAAGKARYNASPKGKAHKGGPTSQAVKRRYVLSAKGKIATAARHRRYRMSPQGKAQQRVITARRRHQRGRGDFTGAQWLALLERHNRTCAYCGRSDRPLTQDHLIPLCRGGEHTADNIVPACLPCNLRKGARIYAP